MPLPVDVGQERRDQGQDQAAAWPAFYRAQDPKLGSVVDRAGEREAVTLLMALVAWSLNRDFLAEHQPSTQRNSSAK